MTKVDVDELKEALHIYRGSALVGMHQALSDSPQKAVRYRAEMYAYHRVMKLLSHYEDTRTWPDSMSEPLPQAYGTLSDTMQRVDEIANEHGEENGIMERGVE